MSQLVAKEIADKSVWESFLLSLPNPSFLQSWNNKLLIEKLGHTTKAIGLFENEDLIGVCLIDAVRAKRGNYLYAPYGPCFKQWKGEYLRALVDYLTTIAKQEGFDFLRFAPYVEATPEYRNLFRAAGFRTSPIHMLAETLWVLDITKSPDDLMKGMRKTTRNLVRRAMKEQVTVKEDLSQAAVEEFIALHRQTEARHQFVAYGENLFRSQVEAFSADREVSVFTASHQNQVIASAIIMFYGPSAAYHHGASVYSKIPAAYLLQWQAIMAAKERGCTQYNFWGITESEDKKHPFYGLSLFKKGFGGQVRHLLPCQDLPLSAKYAMTYAIESVRRIRRGFGLKRQEG